MAFSSELQCLPDRQMRSAVYENVLENKTRRDPAAMRNNERILYTSYLLLPSQHFSQAS